MKPFSRWESGLHRSSKPRLPSVASAWVFYLKGSIWDPLNRNACLGWLAVTDKGVLGGRRKFLSWITKEMLIALFRGWQWGVEGGVSDSIIFIKGFLEHWFSTFLILPLFSTVHVVTYNHKIISGATYNCDLVAAVIQNVISVYSSGIRRCLWKGRSTSQQGRDSRVENCSFRYCY